MWLWTCLSVVFAHILVVCCAETNCALFALVTDIDTDKHCLIGNFWTKLHSPQITTELGIHLTYNVQKYSVVIFSDSSICDELRNNGTVAIYLVFEERVEVLVV